jgi:hypothetical protein
VLDMNEELAGELVQELGENKVKFFSTNVLETESIAGAVRGTLEWAKETGREIGGVIAAAGVATPAKVSLFFVFQMFERLCVVGRNSVLFSVCICVFGVLYRDVICRKKSIP